MDILGSAFALQALQVDLKTIRAWAPVFTGGGEITFSHGIHPVPAPATRCIIELRHLPASPGPVEQELLTPTGAALLAALNPQWIDRPVRGDFAGRPAAWSYGFGTRTFPARTGLVNALGVTVER